METNLNGVLETEMITRSWIYSKLYRQLKQYLQL